MTAFFFIISYVSFFHVDSPLYASSTVSTGAILIELPLLKIEPIDDLIEFLICFKAESPRFLDSTGVMLLVFAYGLLQM